VIPVIPEALLQALGIGVHGAPGETTQAGARAVQDVAHPPMLIAPEDVPPALPPVLPPVLPGAPPVMPGAPPVLPLAAGTDHTATWATMFNLTDLTAHQTNALKGLDPATMFNMRDGGGALSDLAHGASQGNGARSSDRPQAFPRRQPPSCSWFPATQQRAYC
jgi:hypothetical protein